MEGRMYVPNSKKLKEKILQENHDSVDIEYPGQQRILVARTKRKRQEIHTRMFQMSTKQSLASEEVRRTTPIGDSTRTMAED